jgi:hypothetical protein
MASTCLSGQAMSARMLNEQLFIVFKWSLVLTALVGVRLPSYLAHKKCQLEAKRGG